MDHWQESVGRLLWDREIPLSVCVPYTLFVCSLVPVYWRYYGPANFLWFSDLALLITLAQRHRQWSFVLVGPEGNLGAHAAYTLQ